MDDEWFGVEVVDDCVDCEVEVCVEFVYFVDEVDVGYVVFVGLVLDGFGLGFDVFFVVEYGDCIVEYVE